MMPDFLNFTDAVILAGGQGSRLQNVLKDRPKPMALIDGKPFLEWLLLWLRNQGIKRAILSVGYMSDRIVSHFNAISDFKMELIYARDPSPLGTGGAVRNALQHVQSKTFFVLNGDSHCGIDLEALLKHHGERQANATLGLVKVDDCSRYGSVRINDRDEIFMFCEKNTAARAGLINAGVYVFERKTALNIPAQTTVSLENVVLPGLIGHGLYGMVTNGFFMDIGTPAALLRAEKIMAAQFKKEFCMKETKNDHQQNAF